MTQPHFYILLSLRDRDRHGYEILKDVEAGSFGKIRLGPASLYTSLKRLLDGGLVAEVTPPKRVDARRRYYRITPRGRAALTEELDRMEHALALAQRRSARTVS